MSLFAALNSSTAGLRTVQTNVKLVSDNIAQANDPNRTRHTAQQSVDASGQVISTTYRREVDKALMAQVMDLVVRLSREQGLTIVLVEQNARSALAVADHGVVLNLGRVVASADAQTLAADVALRRHYLGF